MKAVTAIIAATSLLLLVFAGVFAAPAMAHEVSNIDHTHAFQQTAYGKYRQGHYVNGPQGSIIVWSPRTYTGYQNGSQVKFARPSPITRAPGQPAAQKHSQSNPAIEYGRAQ